MILELKSEPRPIKAEVRQLRESDICYLEPILREHVRDSATKEIIEPEVKAILSYMRGALDSNDRQRQFLVATDQRGKILGCVAISIPDQKMIEHFQLSIQDTRELLNAFVGQENFRGKGIGRALFEAACSEARSNGATTLVLNSGPRYMESWGFYDKVCDSSFGFIKDYFGAGRDAKTWRKSL